MPIYSFFCNKCEQEFDEIYSVKDRPDSIPCQICGGTADRVISSHGAVLPDGDVKWLPSACKVLLKPGEPLLETRSQWKEYLKRNHLIAVG